MCKLFQSHHVCGCADASWSPRFMRCQCGVRRGRSTVALGRGGGRVNALWMCIQASVHIRSWETETQGDPVWSNPQVVFLLRCPLPTRLPPNNMFVSRIHVNVSSSVTVVQLWLLLFAPLPNRTMLQKVFLLWCHWRQWYLPRAQPGVLPPPCTPSGPPRSSPPPSKHVQEGPTSQH